MTLDEIIDESIDNPLDFQCCQNIHEIYGPNYEETQQGEIEMFCFDVQDSQKLFQICNPDKAEII